MLYIAIDGGGTKTEGVLADRRGAVLSRRLTGASNPHDITPERAILVITELVRDLLTDAQVLKLATDISLFAGVAGVLGYREVMQPALADALYAMTRREFPSIRFANVRLDSDVTILLSAEIPEGDGACVISGTGAVCFVRHEGSVIRIGGWGNLLDGGGSGYNLGRDALEAALRDHDGRGPATALTDLLTAHLGQPAPQALRSIYEGGKAYIAACAPCVFEAAEAGDAVAREILSRNAHALAELITTAYRVCSPVGMPLPIVLGGGLCQKRPDWVKLIASQLPDDLPVRLTVASQAPVMGALVLARQYSTPDDP